MSETQNTEQQQPAAAPPKPEERPKLLPVVDDGEFAQLLDTNRFAQIQRVAALFSESDLVPEVFQKKTANCAVALQMAFRMRVDPMMLMQNMYIVHGKPGIEAKLAIALMNSRGPFEGPIQWRITGEALADRAWTAYAKHRLTGQVCEATVTWKMVQAEGWDKNSKWKSIPDMMGRYRSATFLGRLYCPEVLLGLATEDELYDVVPRLVSGERIDSGSGEVIDMMPRSRPPAAESTGNAETRGTQAETINAPVETTKAEVETKSAADETPASSAEAKAADAPAADMGTKASKAQKESIIKIASRQGLTVAQLDEHMVARFAFGIDELPVALVGDVIQFLGALRAKSAA